MSSSPAENDACHQETDIQLQNELSATTLEAQSSPSTMPIRTVQNERYNEVEVATTTLEREPSSNVPTADVKIATQPTSDPQNTMLPEATEISLAAPDEQTETSSAAPISSDANEGNPSHNATSPICTDADKDTLSHDTTSTSTDCSSVAADADSSTRPAEQAVSKRPAQYDLRSGRLPRYLHRVKNVWQSRRTRSDYRLIAASLLLLLLVSSLVPLLALTAYGMQAYQTYTEIRAHANSGYQHLLAAKTLFTGARSHPGNMLDTGTLMQAGQDLTIAHSELVETQTLLDQAFFIHAITRYFPGYQDQVTSARAASQLGIDIATIGQQATDVAIQLVPRLRNPLSSTARTPLVTQADLDLIDTTIGTIQPLITDMEVQGQHLSLDALPINAHQRDQIRQLLPLLPQAQKDLTLGQGLLHSLNWLLGVDQPRTFLVQTLDRGELRATGGFTGQYGELKIDAGRVAPFSLHDIALVEYAANTPTAGNLAPLAYRSWWPFANWGLRDSNLSADFPTSAQLAIQQYKSEMHTQVDGVISFTPFLVQHILAVIGPIAIPQYHETITAQNLEERLHYYQLDNRGIRKEEIVEKVPDTPDAPNQARKLFTARLSRTLTEHIRQAAPQELLAIGKQLLADLKTRDLQIYVNNAQIEGLLQQYGDAGQIDTATTHDGLYIVQINLSASKASQYVQTVLYDNVSLDATGGALHRLQMRLVYKQLGSVYGLDTYRDYVRIYVPAGAQLRGGDGFDTGQPLCGGILGACPYDGIYPHNELVCPPGQYDAGAAAPMLNDPYIGEYHPLDTIGAPTNTRSDMAGRAMFGGWIVIPKNCTMTVSLSWYVPPMGIAPYALLVQRQASTFPELHLAIHPAAGPCSNAAPLTFNGVLNADTTFTLKAQAPSVIRDTTVTCSLQTSAP